MNAYIGHADTTPVTIGAVPQAARMGDMPRPMPAGIEVTAPISKEFAEILTPEAMAFVAKLHRTFETRRQKLLGRRVERQKELDAGRMPDFLPETANVRAGD